MVVPLNNQQLVGTGARPTGCTPCLFDRGNTSAPPPVQNYRADFRWLVSACPDLLRARRLILLHGHKKRSADPYNRRVDAVGAASRVPLCCSDGVSRGCKGWGTDACLQHDTCAAAAPAQDCSPCLLRAHPAPTYRISLQSRALPSELAATPAGPGFNNRAGATPPFMFARLAHSHSLAGRRP